MAREGLGLETICERWVSAVYTHIRTWNKFLLQNVHLFPGPISVCLLESGALCARTCPLHPLGLEHSSVEALGIGRSYSPRPEVWVPSGHVCERAHKIIWSNRCSFPWVGFFIKIILRVNKKLLWKV